MHKVYSILFQMLSRDIVMKKHKNQESKQVELVGLGMAYNKGLEGGGANLVSHLKF